MPPVLSLKKTQKCFGFLLAYSYLCSGKNQSMDYQMVSTQSYRSVWIVLQTVLAVMLISITATAQTPASSTWKHSNRFKELPPFRADFDAHLFVPSMGLQQMAAESKERQDTISTQSIMLRHGENMPVPHFHFKTQVQEAEGGDALIDIRDRIVRKRRERQGRPLPPNPPGRNR